MYSSFLPTSIYALLMHAHFQPHNWSAPLPRRRAASAFLWPRTRLNVLAHSVLAQQEAKMFFQASALLGLFGDVHMCAAQKNTYLKLIAIDDRRVFLCSALLLMSTFLLVFG
jgi:hypothetical protein